MEKPWFNKLTIEDIENILNEMYEKQQKRKFGILTDSVVVGFASFIDGDRIYSIEDKNLRQHGKKVLLLKSKSLAHKKLLELEQEYDGMFERLDVETMIKIQNRLHLHFTAEDGTLIIFDKNPMDCPLSTIPTAKNTFRYDIRLNLTN